MNKKTYQSFLQLLKDELIPAMGCTEPIALAYASALAKKYLGENPVAVEVIVSKNIMKNVKSVIVPNTHGLKGISAAVVTGIIAGNSNLVLEVISKVTKKQLQDIKSILKTLPIIIKESCSDNPLDIKVTLKGEQHCTCVQIIGEHDNVTLIQKDDLVILKKPYQKNDKANPPHLSVKEIVNFANHVDIHDVEKIIDRQIDYNVAIAEEGLSHSYGANIGQIMLKTYGHSPANLAKVYASAAADARMSGCNLPVIINSGSGNQGLTVSLPVIIYARELHVSHDNLIRALTIANLVNIHLKTGIGRLSAFCGATCAGVGAGAGICYFYKNEMKAYEHTIVNGLVINSGLICDGAKPSCAAKIASSVDAGLLGLEMALNNSEFCAGEGIVSDDVEKTIENICQLASKGMKETDTEIIELMTKHC
ncbi:MAG: L-serine ammonia-lyase, iron-sulfur-dependent, subunit alpha [Bacilli bacterium]